MCEGYSRAFKSVLDKLGIPCVLVQGVYKHSEDTVELHMWTNVQIDGKWYGVDPTMDDPINTRAAVTNGLDGYENHEYLLVSDLKMSQHHTPGKYMSEAEYPFSYPMLDIEDFGVEVSEFDNGLVVKYNANAQVYGEDLKAGEYRISFRGMGYKKAAENGYYMVCRFYSPDNDMNDLVYTDWYHIRPEIYNTGTSDFYDTDTELVMVLPQIEYIEFGITESAPSSILVDGKYPDSAFYGDPYLMTATTGMLHNASGTYKAPPYPKKSSPRLDCWLDAETSKPYHVEIEFDDVLVPDGSGEIGLELRTENKFNNKLNAVVGNVEFDGTSTVSFDFTPDSSWAGDNTFYNFTVKGLVGESSGKAPVEFTYGASFRCAVCAYRSQGYFWNLYAQPTLIENSDISTQENLRRRKCVRAAKAPYGSRSYRAEP